MAFQFSTTLASRPLDSTRALAKSPIGSTPCYSHFYSFHMQLSTQYFHSIDGTNFSSIGYSPIPTFFSAPKEMIFDQ